ncbi:thiol reductant ABC exporter subunit CydC [Halomonas sp. YLGW01]|uniref:thiol reductant ABC exporter subunit CydC n=1 Tax=Halomonas sp. YLGW01 TaxID=2773308 RepID=UPI001F5B5F7A|nr:thiol reductant ABC exporter subunit CydC [Halomonas sp. YLGW01]
MSDLISELRPWLKLLARRRARMALGALLLALTVGAAIGLLALSGWFITATALTGALLAAGVAASLEVYAPGGGIRSFAVLRTVARYLERVYNHDSVLRLLAELRSGMFAVLARLDARALGQRRASEWLNRLTADIDTLDSLYLRLLAPPLVALLAIALVSGLLGIFLLSAGLSVGAMLLALWAWLVVGQARLGMAASTRRVATLDRLRGRILETLQGLAELKSYDTLASHRTRIEEDQSVLYADQWHLGRIAALGNALVGLGVGLAAVLVLWLGAEAYRAEALSGPLMVMMPLAVLAMGEALGALPTALTALGATRAAARRLNTLGRSRSVLTEPEAPLALPGGAPTLRLHNVTLKYPGALTPALAGLDLRLEAGERLALLGTSGAGKSSVAALLVRLLDPDRGEVRRDDVLLGDLALDDLRTRTTYLTQHSELFDDSLAANLRLAAPDAEEAALWRVLQLVELAAWARELPQGLATRVGEGGRQLSGGQARRLVLARVLLLEAPLVILDEPFAGLDRSMASRIAERLDTWLAGRTVLYLVHQLRHDGSDPPGVTRTLTLREGRLV